MMYDANAYKSASRYLLNGVVMGYTSAKVKIYNPEDRSKFIELDLVVDTGSTYTWIKEDRLKGLGLKTMDVRSFRTIDNRVIKRSVGEAVVECLGK